MGPDHFVWLSVCTFRRFSAFERRAAGQGFGCWLGDSHFVGSGSTMSRAVFTFIFLLINWHAANVGESLC